jgi:PilZ domain
MTFEGKSRRLRERLKLALPVLVRGRESSDFEWSEMTRLVDVTPFGARLRLKREVGWGRLLRLMMLMPRQMRSYDFVEEQYVIWGVVRHATALLPEGELGPAQFDIGLAFIGKHPPASYEKDPATLYDVEAAPGQNGMWRLRVFTGEAPRLLQKERRKETRLTLAVPVTVEALDYKGEVAAREETVTENISRHGAAVYTSLDIAEGDFVRLRSAQYHTVSALVRSRRRGADGITRLHLEFVGRPWPIEGVE